MDKRSFIEPDTKFIREVISSGGASVKKCFQCSTCTVICPLSPDDSPFPRKEMIWAQWGLKDKLVKDPDIWLCHRCTDCSTYCPRGAKPGDVLAAVRSLAIRNYAAPRFIAKALASPKYLPLILAIPALLFYIFLAVTGSLTLPHGEIVLGHFISINKAYIGMIAIFAFVFVVAGIGIYRFWKSINEVEPASANKYDAKEGLLGTAISTIIDILKHGNFRKCGVDKIGYYTHLGIFYGFILLLLAAFIGAIYHFAGIESPYPLTGPVKIVGNLGALLLTVGCMLAIYRRLANSTTTGNSTYFDWLLILTLFSVTVSGIAVEVVRLAEMATATYYLYIIHLWLMFMLLIYAPFSKGAHLIYRTLAMIHARQVGRGGG